MQRDLELTKPQMSHKKSKQILKNAFEILQEILRKKTSKKPCAIITDIDGTAIKNEKSGNCHCNRPMLKICEWAMDHNVEVFFVTARPDEPNNRALTLNDLARCGFYVKKPQTHLRMRPPADLRRNRDNYSAYKASTRIDIARTHDVLMSFGDTVFDMTVVYDTERGIVALNTQHSFVTNLKQDRAYLLVLDCGVPAINVKLKAESRLKKKPQTLNLKTVAKSRRIRSGV